MDSGLPEGQLASQPLLVPNDYRNIKVTDGMTIMIDLEELKAIMRKSD